MFKAVPRISSLAGLAALLLPALAPAAEFTATVVRVKDGDTIVVLHDNKQIDIRLEGIDCPESGQAFGQKAKQATAGLAHGKMVTVQPPARTSTGGRWPTCFCPMAAA